MSSTLVRYVITEGDSMVRNTCPRQARTVSAPLSADSLWITAVKFGVSEAVF